MAPPPEEDDCEACEANSTLIEAGARELLVAPGQAADATPGRGGGGRRAAAAAVAAGAGLALAALLLNAAWAQGGGRVFMGSGQTIGRNELYLGADAGAEKEAPVLEFYMYRASAEGALEKYPFGDINTGNMDGVIWYLMNEVVTEYTNGARCPRKFNISRIHRFKVRTQASPELFAEGMNFGTRFAYDTGKCMGRCFAGNLCTNQSDCDYHYNKYGYIPGCNNFYDKYPFPDGDTPASNGIWYTLPLAGRCDKPTGAHDCTWSYEHAGHITLRELEDGFPGEGNCCNGHCTSFWDDQFNGWKTTWRVQQALDVFARKFPDQPRELDPAKCDFQWWKWYSHDRWDRRDPWAPAVEVAAK